jgi:hypothetical protein
MAMTAKSGTMTKAVVWFMVGCRVCDDDHGGHRWWRWRQRQQRRR